MATIVATIATGSAVNRGASVSQVQTHTGSGTLVRQDSVCMTYTREVVADPLAGDFGTDSTSATCSKATMPLSTNHFADSI